MNIGSFDYDEDYGVGQHARCNESYYEPPPRLPDDDEEEDEYFEDDVEYGGQAYTFYSSAGSFPASISSCQCINCGNGSGQHSDDYESHCCGCDCESSNNQGVFDVSGSYQYENGNSSDQTGGGGTENTFTAEYHGTFNNFNPARDDGDESDPDFEDFLNTFHTMGLSSPVNPSGGGGAGGSDNNASEFVA